MATTGQHADRDTDPDPDEDADEDADEDGPPSQMNHKGF